ncbi:hypothetical protein RSAG8_00871, partial [Rhizoctonia solani AG-8 WAC10335]
MPMLHTSRPHPHRSSLSHLLTHSRFTPRNASPVYLKQRRCLLPLELRDKSFRYVTATPVHRAKKGVAKIAGMGAIRRAIQRGAIQTTLVALVDPLSPGCVSKAGWSEDKI